MGIIISENLVECVKMSEENSEDSQALINEAVELLVKVNDKYNNNYSNVSYWYLRRVYFGLVGIGEPLLFTQLLLLPPLFGLPTYSAYIASGLTSSQVFLVH